MPRHVVKISNNPTYEELVATYPTVWNDEPMYAVVTPYTLSAIKAKFTPQQRFMASTLGLIGLQFFKATIVASRYAPSGQITYTNDPFEEPDPFDEWVKDVREQHAVEAKKPKNHATREFLDRRHRAGRYRR